MTAGEVMTKAHTAEEALAHSRGLAGPALRLAVESLPASIRRVAGYHFGWWDEQGRASAADGGKAFRPALVLLAAEGVGGEAANAVAAAVSIELIHNFSLLHDDVMDGDVTRRHRPTAWHVFGLSSAILAGDALLGLAFEVLAASGNAAARESAEVLGGAVQELLEGQALDLAFEQRTEVSIAECQAMAAGKTGALLGAACALGALFGGGQPEQVTHLQSFGEKLGLAFQFADDLLGIWGDPAITGKPVYSDLRNRKKSLPVVAALASGSPEGRRLAARYHREEAPTGAELAEFAALIEDAGARRWAQEQADELLTEALRHLWLARPASRAAAELDGLARLATRRDR